MERVRGARLDDAAALARVHVRAWREGYRGLIAGDVIAARAARRQDEWIAHLACIGEHTRVVVAEVDRAVVGFASGGPSPDDDLNRTTTAEVTGLYVDPGHWRQGLGRVLLAELLRQLRRERFASATLWVLAKNDRARRFYEAAGWELEGAERRNPERRALEIRYRLRRL